MFNHLGETNEVQRFVHSRMKCIYTLDVKIDASLKVERRNLVITSCKASMNSKDEIKEEEQVCSKHITIREANDLEAEVEPAEVLRTL